MEKVGIGIIGGGNINEAYLKLAAGFPITRSPLFGTSSRRSL